MPEGISFVAIFDWVKNVSSFLVAFTAIIAFIKPLREWLIRKIRIWAGYAENEARDKETVALLEKKEQRLEEKIVDNENRFADMMAVVIGRLDSIDGRLNGMDTKLIAMQEKQFRTEDFEKRELRAQIVDIYYNYLPTKKIPAKKKKVLCEKYEMYVDQYHGNSWVEGVFQEIMNTWETVED